MFFLNLGFLNIFILTTQSNGIRLHPEGTAGDSEQVQGMQWFGDHLKILIPEFSRFSFSANGTCRAICFILCPRLKLKLSQVKQNQTHKKQQHKNLAWRFWRHLKSPRGPPTPPWPWESPSGKGVS